MVSVNVIVSRLTKHFVSRRSIRIKMLTDCSLLKTKVKPFILNEIIKNK